MNSILQRMSGTTQHQSSLPRQRSRLSSATTALWRRTGITAVGVCALIALHSPARADIIWNFSYSGTFPNYGPHYDQSDIISGQLTTTSLNTVTGAYTIIGITGTDNGSAITGLDTNHVYTDNRLYSGTPYLDFDGFSFTTAAGDDVNLYYNAANGHYWDWFDYGATLVSNGTFTVSEVVPTGVPEPASLALLGGALVGFGLMRRRMAV